MSSSTSLSLSPSIEANQTLATLMRSMHRIAPLSLADSSWDNVGLLLEAPFPRSASSDKSGRASDIGKGVHLCIDLTTSVLSEVLQHPHISTILCYHPIIFRGLKTLTLSDPQQATLLRCAAEGISVYCPHTSLDAARGGINDWLAEGCKSSPSEAFSAAPAPCQKSKATSIPEGHEGAGMGRHFSLAEPVELITLVQRLKKHLGLEHVQVATPAGKESPMVQSIAVCAGSGGSVLAGDESDCWLTGEMSHHELLAATAAGRSVILTNHSNTERGYLSAVLKPRLEELAGGDLQVSVSEVDRDPLRVV
ncbi:NGG1p interacting factor 3 [Microstroma glucosiphilum]|uniref:NGG1p interacting factor 3 n=1 Tax=Pseudomicrostroma glucosiphilum TaxID=1684307 RepID=A0A316U4E1_9BASI|nr:NGG1p interacting factor 3 [Pseudomicrostroma glucosiphilum]PWN19223.1 NGG1p interacting factor 3 [Pseudomicrostroma glucosiphilum]